MKLRTVSFIIVLLLTCRAGDAQAADSTRVTVTPIEHLIVIVGENITFDNLFATYEAPAGETVGNLLSRGIVDRDGKPGPRFADATQREASVRDHYAVTPATTGAYATLPQPGTTYAKGLPRDAPDTRFPSDLPNGPFRITRYVAYESPVGDPIHRFFQMWQQIDGGKKDLFTWVAVTSGEGSRTRDDPTSSTNQGGVALGFYSMASGDAPYFRELAQKFAIADNYHQPVMGGTGANFLALGTGHAGVYLENGKPATPPPNQIEDPDPREGTNNWYRRSGYRGGSYTACADPSQPGVKAIRDYLAGLPYKAFNDGNCARGSHYIVNNYSPGYSFDGSPQQLGASKYVLPPQITPEIGSALAKKGVSWKWYSGGRTASGIDKDLYCSICDPLTHSTAVMTSPLRANLQGLEALYRDLGDEKTLPAVSFVIPPNPESGHPAFSTVFELERFVKSVVARVQASPAWSRTAILITTDEGGGYYDSGYIQIIDFFGDGTRIPLIAVSPFAKKGHVDHTYYDHASVLKFIERNWKLPPLSEASRDNLPNPVMSATDPYVPTNRPAVGDLMNLFDFKGR
ncbi:MAG TPA: alkaline phosphatase family protein [Casimicrobiaceae bacterium]|nr:alkaline phosphatase family protein [Casimicrobiaceae bacterium]